MGDLSRYRGAAVGGSVGHRAGRHHRRGRVVGAGQRPRGATGDRLARPARGAVESWDQVCGDRHVGDLRQGRAGGVAACAADRRSVPLGQTGQRDARCGASAHHCGASAAAWPQMRSGVDQPAPAAARGRTTDRRATQQVVRTAHVGGPQRRHRGRLDRQRATTRCVGLQRPWRTALRNLGSPIRVLHVLRRLLGARDPAAGPDDLLLAGTHDPGHSDRPVQRP